ncbi:MAG: hypothetical protein OEZ58_07065 [Gammaproteobacteria bacterium]|nr:hypothetical protein [Gammaproteobacteria bacterium]MDH5728734.1 hypothetical protein [Gammaproteobacteria bacterium]
MKYFTRLNKVILAVTLLGLSACATLHFGKDFDSDKFQQWVKQGQTSQDEVKSFLGEPTNRGKIFESNGSQYTRWVYYYAAGKPPNFKDARFKMLEVIFNSNKVVDRYNWSAQ